MELTKSDVLVLCTCVCGFHYAGNPIWLRIACLFTALFSVGVDSYMRYKNDRGN